MWVLLDIQKQLVAAWVWLGCGTEFGGSVPVLTKSFISGEPVWQSINNNEVIVQNDLSARA